MQSWKIVVISHWNVEGVLQSPICITWLLNVPSTVANAIIWMCSSTMHICSSASDISSFEQYATLVRGWPVFHSQNISESFQLWPQTPSAFFRLWLPPSSGDTLEYFLFRAPSSSPQCYCMLLPLWSLTRHPLRWLLWDSASSEGNPETSLDSTPATIKGWVIKVIHDVKGRWWSGSMGNARWWPWL